jgi:hypothetical protein
MENWEEDRATQQQELERRLQGGESLPPLVEDIVNEDAKEEVGGMAGAMLKNDDLDLSWEKAGRSAMLRSATKLSLHRRSLGFESGRGCR